MTHEAAADYFKLINNGQAYLCEVLWNLQTQIIIATWSRPRTYNKNLQKEPVIPPLQPFTKWKHLWKPCYSGRNIMVVIKDLVPMNPEADLARKPIW
jgi:hypothetical protein